MEEGEQKIKIQGEMEGRKEKFMFEKRERERFLKWNVREMRGE